MPIYRNNNGQILGITRLEINFLLNSWSHLMQMMVIGASRRVNVASPPGWGRVVPVPIRTLGLLSLNWGAGPWRGLITGYFCCRRPWARRTPFKGAADLPVKINRARCSRVSKPRAVVADYIQKPHISCKILFILIVDCRSKRIPKISGRYIISYGNINSHRIK